MAEKVIIKEVAARDGLQAQPKHLTVEQRIALLGALAETGVPELEIGSFVSPKAVPQMAGTASAIITFELRTRQNVQSG